MIVDLWLTFFNKILAMIVSKLPIASFPDVVNNVLDWMTNMWGIANFFVPMGELAFYISLMISIEIILFAFKIWIFIYRLIPGKAT